MRKILLCGLVGLGVYSSFNCGQNKQMISGFERKLLNVTTNCASETECEKIKKDILSNFEDNKDVEIISKKQLSDLSGKYYDLHEFKDSGYAIYVSNSTKLLEISLSSESPFKNQNKNLAYFGAGNYYKKTIDSEGTAKLFNLRNKEEIDYTSSVERSINSYMRETKLYSNMDTYSSGSGDKTETASVDNPEVFKNANTGGFNTDGNCGYVSGALLIYYARMSWGWDWVYDKDYITNDLVKELQGDRANDSIAPNLEDALNDYLNAKGSKLKAKVNMWHIPASHTFYDRVEENKPVSMFCSMPENFCSSDGDVKMGHVPTVYKVKRKYSVGWFGIRTYSNYMYTIHMGWSMNDNEVVISDDVVTKGGLVNLHK